MWLRVVPHGMAWLLLLAGMQQTMHGHCIPCLHHLPFCVYKRLLLLHACRRCASGAWSSCCGVSGHELRPPCMQHATSRTCKAWHSGPSPSSMARGCSQHSRMLSPAVLHAGSGPHAIYL